ncbi:MAG: acetate--CoA ligase [Candidatus Vogelbacteria bacterium]|nr:acetate--CoA ligase [Candidatus Vogelbacteria bacterium]
MDTILPNEQQLQEALISKKEYRELYRESVKEPERFWATVASNEIEWFKKWNKTLEWDYPHYKWFVGGKINITHNCLDRHIKNGNGDAVALVHVDENYKETIVTYSELLQKVNRLANGLLSLDVVKGDRIVLYMPLMIEQVVTMLACARIGAIHSVIFAGFSDKAVRERIIDLQAKIIVTANWTIRRGQKKELKPTIDEAIEDLEFVKHVIVVQRDQDRYVLVEKDVDYEKLVANQSDTLKPEIMDAEDPLFVLYTSGSTGKPKGIVHTTAGYSLYAHYTSKCVFNLKKGDVYWCTADPGWITGHSYVVYGPLSVGATSVMVEGVPDYPSPDRWWKLIDRFKINVLYTSPTAIRMLRKLGEQHIKGHDLSSLKIIGSVGEPISPQIWEWFYEHIGRKKCVLVDTWWQTETGGQMIVSLPALSQKPGKAGLPFFGIEVDIIDKNGNSVPNNAKGLLVIKKPWPGAMRTCWNNDERFAKYWTEIKDAYLAGDIAIRDDDGYIQILGRSDDLINVSGHRIGTAEVESALVSHIAVAEAAVIGKPDEIRGEVIKAFIILRADRIPNQELVEDIKFHVRREIGSHAIPYELEFVDKLPKTRSGKIMRRVLRAKEMGQDLGDLTTLED